MVTANVEGIEQVYSWALGSPAVIDQPPGANIERVNLKSDTKPFLIVSPAPCLRRNLAPPHPAGVPGVPA